MFSIEQNSKQNSKQNKITDTVFTQDSTHMMPMSIKEVADAVNASELLCGSSASCDSASCDSVKGTDIVNFATSDSRNVACGAVFIAIKGERVDGHDFVQKAAQLGAKAAIVEHAVLLDESVQNKIAQIVVKNSVEALGLLAKHNLVRRRALNTPFSIIGITGSVGKTTTKDMLNALLSTLGNTVAPVGSFNNEIGLPLTSLRVNENTRFLIAEMGANHVGEIAMLTTIAPPDLSVVLKVGVAHLGEFGSVEKIAQAKSEIVRGLLPHGVAILNADDFRVAAMSKLADQDKVRWFGLNVDNNGNFDASNNGNYQLRAQDISLDESGCAKFTIIESEKIATSENSAISENSTTLHLALPGAHNVMNALAASNVARYFGMSLKNIALVLNKVSHISPHRMQISVICKDDKKFTLIDDSFNANPDSMKAGIDGLCSYESNDSSNSANSSNSDDSANSADSAKSSSAKLFRIAVLGSMLELGKDEYNMHESIGKYVAQKNIDAIISVGSSTSEKLDELASCIAKGARDNWQNNRNNINNIVNKYQNNNVDAKNNVYFVHDCIEANNIVWSLVGEHSSTVVLLKGSHASGLSVLAESWAKLSKSLNASLNKHTEVNL
ncbi:UDP-N-acetylmuramoyl-tripeptide--D-alanyl-D-alanine ligase [Gardnerella piotii]|uniref:UDP-N-acetylmuramoyl-tripeptide--D-alanyl-D-alanine ligase n=1 Tax=Gardnerella piotii TaxID=2792977 RepID=A0ABU5MRS1_9BIFI|nr:UDP-N-acetylmuramoyl-tripeptide--D-alanyl-D-alanine ligase [Gardnerella piotii]MDZ7545046.1 UDP-N-acetylmuramoyl-tripeptide--D-alanyl-D-alanine ligase [Gardnerella piotii]MDZ7552711.1 UDP-N-acetylmuramoyl-tripeptide--D-alanyl-D-alanine ligase [Gardnerella piotii]